MASYIRNIPRSVNSSSGSHLSRPSRKSCCIAPRLPISKNSTVHSDRSQSSEINSALQKWRQFDFRSHLLAVLAIGSMAVLRWWKYVFLPSTLTDEMIYLGAFQRVIEGQSPFSEIGYLYPSATALVGAWALGWWEQGPILAALRIANILGLAVSVWIALAWLRGSWRLRVMVGGLLVVLAPSVGYGISSGNLSFAVSGMILYGLMCWRRRPGLCGVLLGLSVAIKPLAPVAILVLLVHRSQRNQRGLSNNGGARAHIWAATTAGAIACGLILGLPHLEDLLTVDLAVRASRSISIFRLIHLLGWQISPFLLTAIVAGIAATLARRQPLDRLHLMILSTTATLAATALVRPHTLLLSLPLQVAALTIGLARFSRNRPRSRLEGNSTRLPFYELIFVCLAIGAIQFAEGATAIDDQPAWIQWIGASLPAFAPILLLGYVHKMRNCTRAIEVP